MNILNIYFSSLISPILFKLYKEGFFFVLGFFFKNPISLNIFYYEFYPQRLS